MKLIGYCRVSSKGQENNTSLETQAEKINEWCRFNKHELGVIFTGVESGAGLDRQAFWQALRLLVCDHCVAPYPRTGYDIKIALEVQCCSSPTTSWDGLIAYDLDRIGRSAKDLLWLGFDFLERRKKAIVVLSGINQHDNTSATSRLLYGQLAVMAQFYRENLLERSFAGRKRRAERHEYVCGRPPYGIRRLAPGKVIEDQYEISILNLMSNLHNLGLSYADIAEMLNFQKKVKRNGKNWSPSAVYNVMKKESAIRKWFKGGMSYNYVESERGC